MVYVIISKYLLAGFINFLEKHATLILVIITAFYAFFTWKMAKIMSKQILADITLSNKKIGSRFLDISFIKKIDETPAEIHTGSSFQFIGTFDVINAGAGAGSIAKPILRLKFKNDCVVDIPPRTKLDKYKKGDRLPWVNEFVETVDEGAAIFLRGGEMVKGLELEYTLQNINTELLECIRTKLKPDYYFMYRDNLGHRKALKVEKITDIASVRRP